METIKVCKKCGEDLLINKFHKQKNSKDGLYPYCKECRKEYRKQDRNKDKVREYNKQYRKDNKDTIEQYREDNKESMKCYKERNKYSENEYHRQYRKEHPEKRCIENQKRRSKKLLLPSTLTNKQWENIKLHFSNSCCYCGKELPLCQDHFIALSNGGEYTINNIIPSCRNCNSGKNNKDFFEWYPEYKYYSKKREKYILESLNYKQNIQQLTLAI